VLKLLFSRSIIVHHYSICFIEAPKPVGSAAPPSTAPEPTILVRENNSAEGSHDQHTDNTYENTAKLSPVASRPLLIPQLHSIISAEISTFQKDSFKEEFLVSFQNY